MEKATSKKTLIIIPAYNEQGSIGAVVENIRSHVIDADILVVNDGSQDRTARTARESGAMVISLPYNMGIGTAVQSGFLFAKEKGYHFVVQVDGDGQHPAKEIPRLLEALDNVESHAGEAGSSNHPASLADSSQHLHHFVASFHQCFKHFLKWR